MRLYYAPGACSMAPHIVLREAGYTFELTKVSTSKHETENGEDYLKINPKGYVPTLQLDDGQRLTEVAVVLQYLADQKPEAGLAPKTGTMERYRLMEWLNFISSELHKSLGGLFKPNITPEWREGVIALFSKRCDWLEPQLAGKSYLMGDKFSIADAYLYTVLRWTSVLKVDMSKWPGLQAYVQRVGERAAVKETAQAEGLKR
ncbi:MAG: glutathione transferase GstA [Gammaproteobacteria bacterium]|nr:glutathione transferase GstA [Gammaproteobacteria bacterium]